MTKIVQTQYRENYGSHDWDESGEKECPQAWKNKGGSTYVFHNASDEEIEEELNYSNDYSEQYVVGIREGVITEAFEPWETRVQYIKNPRDNTWVLEHYNPAEEIRTGLKSWKKTWDVVEGTRLNYVVEYVFDGGHVAHSEEDAYDYFEHLTATAN